MLETRLLSPACSVRLGARSTTPPPHRGDYSLFPSMDILVFSLIALLTFLGGRSGDGIAAAAAAAAAASAATVGGSGGLEFIVEPQDTVVEQGGSARLDCQASSSLGQPTIQWRSADDGQAINFIGDIYRSQLANGSLYISSVYSESPELSGTSRSYRCMVTIEDIGSIVSRAATIKIASLPGFDREPQDTMVYPGQIAYLNCALPPTIDGPNSTPSSLVKIQWLKDERPLVLDQSRMTVMPSGALEIDDVTTHDVGSYRCNASGFGQFRLSNKAQLDLLPSDNDQGATAPVFIARPVERIAIEGSSITLECAANGNPRPNIIWLKDGVAVDLAALDTRYRKLAASSLTITDVREEDDGSYQCRAENEIETLDAVAVVNVQVPPRFVKSPRDKVANKKQDLEFECEIYGKPEPKVTWLKNGEKITLSEYWQLVNNYNLRINGLLDIDAGIFQCIGTNPAGSIQASARLTINLPKKSNTSKWTTARSPVEKKKVLSLQRHGQLYNNTWQHPSTLLGHTLSGYTANTPLSISPSDDPADLLGSNNRPDSPDDPDSHFPEDTESILESSLPSAPRNLSVTIVSSRFVTLGWQEPDVDNPNNELLTYYIYYKQEGSQRERVVMTLHKQLEVVVRGLQPGVTYLFRVVAHNARGPGTSSETIRVTTHSEADVPGPPLNLEGHATSSASIAISWNEPIVINGRVSKYLITFMQTESGQEKNRETSSTNYELVELVPYNEYIIWLQAINENGPGAPTGEITVRTYSAQPSQAPHNVTLEAASSTSIIIRWEPPLEGRNGIITGYKIRYRRQDSRRLHSNIVTTEGNQRDYTLSGLEKRGVYHVKICALNVNGTGPWTDLMSIETYENDLDESIVPTAPINLRVKAMSDSISVSWNPPKDDGIKVRGYKIGWGKGFPDVYTQLLDGKQRFFTIDKLEAQSEYVISLSATNDAGQGLPTYANVRTTEKSAPESSSPLTPPIGLKAIVLSANTVVLYWTDSSLSKSQYVTDSRYYVVRYTSYHPSTNPRYKFFNATDLNCMIDDLRPNTPYEFAVKVVKGRRESTYSMVVFNQTQEAPPASGPRDLTVQSNEERSNAATLRWQPPKQPNGQIIGYIISYSMDMTKRDRDWSVDAVVGNKTEYIVKGLGPGVSYYFKIQARNAKGYGPFSSTVKFTTLPSNGMDFYDELHGRRRDGRGGISNLLIYVIVGSTIVLATGIAVVTVVFCCRKNPDSPDRKKGYTKDSSEKTNIKPPDLWIHHDQMELKALEKSSINGEASTSGGSGGGGGGGIIGNNSNTLPRSGNQDYAQDNAPVNCNSLDKRTYVPSYMAIASATSTIGNGIGMSQQSTIHGSCGDVPSARANYPRTVAQYSLSRAHITLEPTPESSPDSIPTTYEPLHTQLSYGSTGQSYSAAGGQYAPGNYGSAGIAPTVIAPSGGATVVDAIPSGGGKRLQGHPLKSFSVPAPPPQSAPSTPAQQKHGVSQVTVRPTISGSPYKKTLGSATQLTKNRIGSVSNASHTPEEIERLKPSYSTEELNQEMANLEGLMKDLNAITASEFEC